MQAVEGYYENGQIYTLEQTVHTTKRMRAIITILDEPAEKTVNKKPPLTEEQRRIFDKFTGSVDGFIDVKAEKLEALDEKYADFG